MLCAVVAKIWLPDQSATLQMEALSAGAALAILWMTQWLIRQRFAAQSSGSNTAAAPEKHSLTPPNLTPPELQTFAALPIVPNNDAIAVVSQADVALITQLQQLLFQQKLYLQANLRLTDVAQQLQVPEYRVSRLIRSQFHASNFNLFINSLRIEHVKSLLADPAKKHWPVFVIGLESGPEVKTQPILRNERFPNTVRSLFP